MSAYDELPMNYSVHFSDINQLGTSFELSTSAMRVSGGTGTDVDVVLVPDEENRIFVAAVQGAATSATVAKALAVLNLESRHPLDVLAIAFAGASIPLAAERKRLSDLGVSVVMGFQQLPPVPRARQYAKSLVSLADESPLHIRAA